MPMIEIHADVKRTNELLERIALALEQIVYRQWSVTLQLSKPSKGEDETAVAYSSDRESYKNELLDAYAGRDPNRPIDVDDEV